MYRIDENEGCVFLIEEIGSNIVETNVGRTKQVRVTKADGYTIYRHEIFDIETGQYVLDTENQEPIEIDGVLHPLEDGCVRIKDTAPLPQPTNTEIAQQLSDLKADLIIAGVIS